MTEIRAVTLDAAETLFTVARPVGDTYAAIACDFGAQLDVERLRHGFKVEFPTMPPLAFPDAGADERDGTERAWWRELVRRVVAHSGAIADFDAYFERLYRHFEQPASWVLFPEVRNTLDALNARGIKLAVVSNFDSRLLTILDGLDIEACFDAVVFSSRAGAAKPDMRIFRIALERLGVEAVNTLHVGDNPIADRQGALAAGLQAVLVERRSPKKFADSIEALDQLLDYRVGGSV